MLVNNNYIKALNFFKRNKKKSLNINNGKQFKYLIQTFVKY